MALLSREGLLACMVILCCAARAAEGAALPPPPPAVTVDDSLQWCQLAGGSQVTSPAPVPRNVTLSAALGPFVAALFQDLPGVTSWAACVFVLSASGKGAAGEGAAQALATAALNVLGVNGTFLSGRDQAGSLIGAAVYGSDLTPTPVVLAKAFCNSTSLAGLAAQLPTRTFGTVAVARSSVATGPPTAKKTLRAAATKPRRVSPCWLWRTICYNYFYRGAWRRVCNWAC